MHLTTFCTAVAAALPILMGFTCAERLIEIQDGSTTAAAVDPVKLKARAIGSPAIEARGYSGMQTYVDVSSAEHQNRFNALAPNGWRMISLSVSGDVSATRYAAVWVKTSGPSFQAIHEVRQDALQAFFDKYSSQGYVSTLFTAVGPADNPIMAMVMEKINVGNWEVRYGMPSGDANTPGTLQYQNAQALKNGLYPKTIAIYGGQAGAPARRYAVIYHANKQNVKWHVHEQDVDWNVGTGAVGFEQSQGFYLSYITGDQDSTMAGIFLNTVPKDYIFSGYDNLNEFQAEFNRDTTRNPPMYPYVVQVNGVGANSRYWALWTT